MAQGVRVSNLPEFDPAEQQAGEVIPHDPPASDRSLARRIALQVLYEVDSAHHDAPSVMAVHLQARQISRKAARYVQRLVAGVVNHRAILDSTIHTFAPEWPVDQMAIVDRNILRQAIYEFAVQGHTPVGVAIDEAVQLAKLYGADSSPGFINGVLGAIADDPTALEQLRQPDSSEDGDE